MSTSGSNPNAPATGPQSSTESLVKHLAGLRMAHEAVMLQDAAAVMAGERASVERHRQLMQTGPNGEGANVPSDEMGDIRIGDEVHHHFTSTATGTPAAVQQPSNGGLSELARAGLLAATVALGTTPAAGLATWLATRPTPQPAASAPPPQEFTDNIGGVVLLPPLEVGGDVQH